MKKICSLAMVLLAVLLAGCGGGGGKTGAITYTVSVLPTGSADDYSEAWFVDNSGRVIGLVYPNTGTKNLYVWQPGAHIPQRLNIPDDIRDNIMDQFALAATNKTVNNQGGTTYSSSEKSGNGIVNLLSGTVLTPSDLPQTLGSLPLAINDSDVCVGSFCKDDLGVPLPIVWSASGEPKQLTLPPGACAGSANSLNNSGQIVGTVWGPIGTPGHAVVWNANGSVAKEIAITEDRDLVESRGLLISDNGYVLIGTSDSRWWLVSPNGNVRRLAGDNVTAMNSKGQVTGFTADGPVIWNPDGAMIKLPLPAPDAICHPYDINDDGVVVGNVDFQGSWRRSAVKWTPARTQ